MNTHFRIIEESPETNEIPNLPVLLCDITNNYYLLIVDEENKSYEPRKRYRFVNMQTGELEYYAYNESDILSVLEKYKICDAELIIK